MKNKSNLPYLITVSLLIIGLIILIIQTFLSSVHESLVTISTICIFGGITLTYTICPISLIFQFLHKNKTVFDKWILGLNLTLLIFFIILLVFLVIAFPNDFKDEKDVRKQIAIEKETLDKEYQPVLDYLADYKKKNGVYPDNIDKIIPKSKLFDKYEYHLTENNKGYWLQVYTVNPPIEYYYNDESENNYNFYQGDGFIDGAFDNDYYYQVDDKWHAIMFEHFTRHSKIFGENKIEKETDTWMKDNIDRFNKK